MPKLFSKEDVFAIARNHRVHLSFHYDQHSYMYRVDQVIGESWSSLQDTQVASLDKSSNHREFKTGGMCLFLCYFFLDCGGDMRQYQKKVKDYHNVWEGVSLYYRLEE